MCVSLPLLPLLTSFTCYDRSSFSPPVHLTSNRSHYFFKWTKGEENKKDIEHFLSLSLSSPIYVYIKYFRVLFLAFFCFYSIKMKRKEAKDSRPDMSLRSIDKRRADEEVFVCIYTLETNKK